MSEVKLNLVDMEHTLVGTLHGALVDACVAALSAEPETTAELEAALARYVDPIVQVGAFGSFRSRQAIDIEPWDAGIIIIDLSARIVAAESSYSQPQPEGQVLYHDGLKSTDVPVWYRIPKDWAFFNSIGEYRASREHRLKERTASLPLDARSVLYGRALLEFLFTNVRKINFRQRDESDEAPEQIEQSTRSLASETAAESRTAGSDEANQEAIANEISAIHARWLMTPRDDLRGQSPREILLAKRELIDFDLQTRALQWSLLGEGPPCLDEQSFAYRFGGFGTHECVVYYDLIRHLLWSSLSSQHFHGDDPKISVPVLIVSGYEDDRFEVELAKLEQTKTDWLQNPQKDYEGRIPANIIENERRRLPLALSKHEMIIDEDCHTCVMLANDPDMGPAFWHLDASHMDDDFVFSDYVTREDWEAENRRREEFNQEFNRRWEERRQRIAAGEKMADDFDMDWIDSLDHDRRPSQPDDKAEPADLIQ